MSDIFTDIEKIECKRKKEQLSNKLRYHDLSQLDYTPLFILQAIKPIDDYFSSTFAINIIWDTTMPLKKIDKIKKRFTNYLTKIANDQERKCNKTKGGVFLHIIAPPKYLDPHLDQSIHPKKFILKHWHVAPRWIQLSDQRLKEVHEHFGRMNILIKETGVVISKLLITRCNRVPSVHKILSSKSLAFIITSHLDNYRFGRFSNHGLCPNPHKAKIITINNTETMTRVHPNIKFVNKYPFSPRRQPPKKPSTRKNKIGTSLPKTKCRLSLVKVVGEYWGWDFSFTQFRLKKIDSIYTKSEVVIQTFDKPEISLLKHLLWCFKTYKLVFEPISIVCDKLRLLI